MASQMEETSMEYGHMECYHQINPSHEVKRKSCFLLMHHRTIRHKRGLELVLARCGHD